MKGSMKYVIAWFDSRIAGDVTYYTQSKATWREWLQAFRVVIGRKE